jgi:hypothetical protein
MNQVLNHFLLNQLSGTQLLSICYNGYELKTIYCHNQGDQMSYRKKSPKM